MIRYKPVVQATRHRRRRPVAARHHPAHNSRATTRPQAFRPSFSMPTYTNLTPPTTGEAITVDGGALRVPAVPVIPFIEGDGTGPDIWRASRLVFDAAVRKAYGGTRRIEWLEVLAGEKAKNQLDSWLPDDTLAAIVALPRLDQGPADHASRRRLPLPQRRPAAETRSLRLRPARPLFRGGPLAGQGAGARGHGDLPREHGRHLRGHRVQGALSRSEPRHPVSARSRWAPPTIRFPELERHRHQAHVRGRIDPPRPRRHRLRDQAEAEERHAGAQRQHHEVHRRRVP